MTNEIERRINYSLTTLEMVREKLSIAIDEALPERDFEAAFSIYATGSFGRLEASEGSDLDTFLAGVPQESGAGYALSGLDEKVLIGRIIEIVRRSGLPDLDRDGEFIKYYTSAELVRNIGLTCDEVSNTFTARLLLLLESKSLYSQSAHDDLLKYVINVYWRDFDDYPTSFRPTFLLNDILKYWRLLCVDYESKMTQDHENVERRRKDRRIKNLKLRYNRMMTCFSTVAAMCDRFARNGSVSRDSALEICKSSPIGRLERIAAASDCEEVQKKVSELKIGYDQFLQLSAKNKQDLIEKLQSDDEFANQRKKADDFGRGFFELIRLRAGDTELFRYLIV